MNHTCMFGIYNSFNHETHSATLATIALVYVYSVVALVYVYSVVVSIIGTIGLQAAPLEFYSTARIYSYAYQ